MKLIRCVLLVVVTLALAASCSRLPVSNRSDEHTTSIRAEYLENHPDGKYNTHITEGRVVKGMGVVEVLASWGLPNTRRSVPQDNAEFWTYYAKDQQTQQVVSYELVFQAKVLSRWVVHANSETALGANMPIPAETPTIEETLRLGPGVTGDELSPKKK